MPGARFTKRIESKSSRGFLNAIARRAGLDPRTASPADLAPLLYGRAATQEERAAVDAYLELWDAEGSPWDRWVEEVERVRGTFARWIGAAHDRWRAQVDEALRQALVNLDAVPAPAGEMDVVLGPGWPGVLLHEAVGHGLEGVDENLGQGLLERFFHGGPKIFRVRQLFVGLKNARGAHQMIERDWSRQVELLREPAQFARVSLRQRRVQVFPGK